MIFNLRSREEEDECFSLRAWWVVAKNYAVSFTPQSNLMCLRVATFILQIRKLEFREVKLPAESLNQ